MTPAVSKEFFRNPTWNKIWYGWVLCLVRNRMCARSRAAQSATQTPAPSGSTWRPCTARRHTSPRSSGETSTQGLHHQGTQAATLRPGHQAIRLRVQLVSRRTSATLPQSGKNASKWKRSSQKNQWYAIHCATPFVLFSLQPCNNPFMTCSSL